MTVPVQQLTKPAERPRTPVEQTHAAYHQPNPGVGSMGSDTITVPLIVPFDEAGALAQFVKRIDYDTCVRFASVFVFYSGRTEGDTMWSAVCLVQRQLAEAGFNPR